MILPAQTILAERPLEPLVERGVVNGVSYGLGPAGYDVRLDQSLTLTPGHFALGSTLERFQMPDDVLATVHDKSSWARRGIAVQTTVIEPGWHGYLTLEITNHGTETITLDAGTPIAQILFHRLEAPTDRAYAGKYQGQQRGPQKAIMEDGTP